MPPCLTPDLAFEVESIDGLTAHVNITACDPGPGATFPLHSPHLSGESGNIILDVRAGHYDYTFRNPGTHQLRLIGRNDCGKSAQVIHEVTVSAAPPTPVPPTPVPPTPVPARGEIIGIDYPAKVKAGAKVSFLVTVKNVGSTTEKFTVGVFRTGVDTAIGVIYPFDLAAGAQVTKSAIGVRMPVTALSGTVKLYRYI